MPTRRAFLVAATLGSMIYAIGGHNHQIGDMPVVERFNYARGRWEAMPSMAKARSNHGVAVFDGQIYVFYGESGVNNCFGDCETFRPAARGNGGAWSTVTGSMVGMRGRAAFGMASL